MFGARSGLHYAGCSCSHYPIGNRTTLCVLSLGMVKLSKRPAHSVILIAGFEVQIPCSLLFAEPRIPIFGYLDPGGSAKGHDTETCQTSRHPRQQNSILTLNPEPRPEPEKSKQHTAMFKGRKQYTSQRNLL